MRSFIRTTSTNLDFIELVELLDADLAIRDGEDHQFYAQFNKIDTIKNVIVVLEDGKVIGCGAFKRYDEASIEIKRMYVKEEARGKKIASQIISELELWAKELGYKNYVLETGIRQPEAIALYHKMGYHIIENYGQYANLETSICFKKSV